MNRTHLSTLIVLAAAAVSQLTGCAGSGARGKSEATPLRPAQSLPIFRGDGTLVGFESVVSSCAQAQVVMIGEIHGHPQGLDFAAALWEGVLARSDRAALSMEFFERDQQVGLDDYLDGVTDEAAFKKATNRTEGGYPPGHRRMVEAAKSAGRPVIASNAPRRYVRLARTGGYERLESLTTEQKRLFDAPTAMPSEAYHDRFVKLMSGMGSDPTHGAPSGAPAPDPAEEAKAIEGFYRAQVVWDATMAASLDRALAAGLGPIVHVVGGFHVAEDGGTVQLLRDRRPDASIVTVVVVDSDATTLRSEDKDKASYIVYVGPSASGQ